MNLTPPLTTLERRLVAGETVRAGEEQPYRRVAAGPGESRITRRDALPARTPSTGRGGRRSLAVLLHLTDLQLADTSSPGRFEFFESLRGESGAGAFVPAQRPQETMAMHAVEALSQAVRSLGGSPDTGSPIDLAVSTGDNVDNAQLNELVWYLSLLAGSAIPGRPYDGVQAAETSGELYWHPDGGPDRWRRRYGFPDHPGLLAEAANGFAATGLGLPWLSCFGNHDGLPFGECIPTPEYRRLVTATRKPTAAPPAHRHPLGSEEALYEHPEWFLAGEGREVTPSRGREIGSRRAFVAAHLNTGGLPHGHGYTIANYRNETAYGTYDGIAGVRVILCDTANLDGRADGSIGRQQLTWLEEALAGVHGRHLAPDGSQVRRANEDRLVVLASHHGLSSLTNDREVPGGLEPDQPRATAAEVAALLARFPNVVCWINGHRHRNVVEYRPAPAGGFGYWEIATASMADWPSQARLVELARNRDGSLSLLCTMVDHAGLVDPRASSGTQPGADAAVLRLAGLHRELAGNVPLVGYGSRAEGRPEDRNVELLLPAPFHLP